MTTITFNNANLSEFLTKFDVGVESAYIALTVSSNKKLALNYGTGEQQNRIIGEPIISEDKTKFSGNKNFLNTEFKDSDAITIFTIAKRPNTNLTTDAATFSNHGGSAQIGVGLYWYKNGDVSFAAARLTTAGVATSAQISLSGLANDQWAFVCAETSSLDANEIKNLTTGASAQSPLKTQRALFKDNVFRIGSSYATVFSGEIDHFMTVAFNKLLSSEEKQIVEKSMRKLALSHGIIV